jgi:hypothetical protein
MTTAIIDITFRGLLIVLTSLLLGYHFPDLRKSIVPKLSVFATDLTENVLVVLRPAQGFCGVAVVAEDASPGEIRFASGEPARSAGRCMPSFFILYIRLVRLRPSFVAAPLDPPITHPLASRA